MFTTPEWIRYFEEQFPILCDCSNAWKLWIKFIRGLATLEFPHIPIPNQVQYPLRNSEALMICWIPNSKGDILNQFYNSILVNLESLELYGICNSTNWENAKKICNSA